MSINLQVVASITTIFLSAYLAYYFSIQSTRSKEKKKLKKLLFDSFVSSYKTPIPPIELTEKFCEFMTPIQIKKEKNLKENQELASLRDWLLPMLMNGQVSVGEVAKDYEMKEEVLGRVAEGNVEYKKGLSL